MFFSAKVTVFLLSHFASTRFGLQLLTMLNDIRPFFSETSSAGLWAISTSLCFPFCLRAMERSVLLRWVVGTIALGFLAMSAVGVKDDHREKRQLVDVIRSTATKEDVQKLGAKIDGARPKPAIAFRFKKENFRIKLNGKTRAEGPVELKREEGLSVSVLNMSNRNLTDYYVDLAWSGCEIWSEDSRWVKTSWGNDDVRFESVTLHAAGDNLAPVTPTMTQPLPDLRMNCSGSGGLLVSIRLNDYQPFEFRYTVNQN